MVCADLAEMFLAKLRVNIAKPCTIQERTSLLLIEQKAAIPDVVMQTPPEDAGDLLVKRLRLCINVDLPANAAAIPASTGNAPECIVLIWCGKLHGKPPFCGMV